MLVRAGIEDKGEDVGVRNEKEKHECVEMTEGKMFEETSVTIRSLDNVRRVTCQSLFLFFYPFTKQ